MSHCTADGYDTIVGEGGRYARLSAERERAGGWRRERAGSRARARA
jgi:hypothetical protein